jgi:hypothetical protein
MRKARRKKGPAHVRQNPGTARRGSAADSPSGGPRSRSGSLSLSDVTDTAKKAGSDVAGAIRRLSVEASGVGSRRSSFFDAVSPGGSRVPAWVRGLYNFLVLTGAR